MEAVDIERTMEFILQQQERLVVAQNRFDDQFAKSAERQAETEARLTARAAATEARLNDKIQRLTERTERTAEVVERLAQTAGTHEKEIVRIGKHLDRAIRLGIREARAERKRRQEMDARWDEKMTQLAAAQLITEEKLQNLIASQRRSTNGGPQPQ